jgi:hypothetical protein
MSAVLLSVGLAWAGGQDGDIDITQTSSELAERCDVDARSKPWTFQSHSDFVVCVIGNETDGYRIWPALGNYHDSPLTSDRLVLVTKAASVKAKLTVTGQAATAPVSEAAKAADQPSSPTTFNFNAKSSDAVIQLGRFAKGTVKIELGSGESGSTSTASLTLAVSDPVTGGVRVGIAAIMGGAASAEFATKTSEANPEYKLVYDSGSGVDVEFVLGYSRNFHRRTPSTTRFRVAPSAAVGIINIKDIKLEALSSVYLGIDVGWDDLSIGPAFVLRKVDSLAGELRPGMLTARDTLPIHQVWQPGLAVVLYSPALLNTSR